MRQEIAYGLVVVMLIAAATMLWLRARRVRNARKGNLRIDLSRKD